MALSWTVPGFSRADKRKAKRIRQALGFTRTLAMRPMFTAPYGKVPPTIGVDGLVRLDTAHDRQLGRLAEWSEAMDAWRRHWTKRREDSQTLRLGRRAHKARLARFKVERVQAQKWLAKTVAGVAGLRFTRC